MRVWLRLKNRKLSGTDSKRFSQVQSKNAKNQVWDTNSILKKIKSGDIGKNMKMTFFQP